MATRPVAKKTARKTTPASTPQAKRSRQTAAKTEADSASLVQLGLGDTEPGSYDWPHLLEELNRYLRLRTTPSGMKLFPTVEAMEAIPRIRRPTAIHTTDQIVAMAARLH